MIRRCFAPTFLLLFLIHCQSPFDAVLQTTEILGIYPYHAILPKDYDASKTYPLILFLHGSGCGSDNVDVYKLYGMGIYADQNEDFPFIVIAPQSYDQWYSQPLDSVLKDAVGKYSVNTERIYCTGFSMGGAETYRLAFDYPHWFAAIAPIAAYGNPDAAYQFAHIPTWIFHNKGDPSVDYLHALEMYYALEANGCDVKLTTYYSFEHSGWYQAYTNPEIYDWFLTHERDPKQSKAFSE